MRHSFIVGVTITALAILETKPANAQFTCNHTPTGRYEIFIEVLSTVVIKITNLETGQQVYSTDIAPSDNYYKPNPGSGNTCDWIANLGTDTPNPPPNANLDWGTAYKIQIGNKVYTYLEPVLKNWTGP